MAIELPSVVAQFLNFIGVPWLNINEDKVRDFASHVRQFGSDIENAHGDATATLKALGSGYQGAAYEALMQMWGSRSTTHVNELVEGCGVLATALDVGADFIVAQKWACIGELTGMALAFAADQAAAFVTFGASEAAMPLIEEGATKLMEFAEQQIEQQLIGEIANAALQPLMGKIENLVQGLVLEGGGSAVAGPSFEVDMGHVESHGEVMQAHAETVSGHVADFTSNLRGLDFTS
ncbi:MAG TPA: WXG100 family type VII secretion target [Actinospica sp.]|nr:WXG100 family type VII secretion target [Actinospica sp.]